MADGENGEGKDNKDEPDSIKGSVALILNAAFLPSAKRFGKELDTRLKNYFDAARDNRRAENLQAHVERVALRIEAADPPKQTVEQLDLLESWAEAAQDVDPDSGDFAHMWQELLVSLAHGRCSDRVVLETLKKLDAYDAGLLMQARRKGYCIANDGRDRFHLKRLAALELVREDRSQQELVLKTVFLLSGVLALYLFFSDMTGMFSVRGRGMDSLSVLHFSKSLISVRTIAAAAILGAAFGSLFAYRAPLRRLAKWRLLWLGQELLRNTTPPPNHQGAKNEQS